MRKFLKRQKLILREILIMTFKKILAMNIAVRIGLQNPCSFFNWFREREEVFDGFR